MTHPGFPIPMVADACTDIDVAPPQVTVEQGAESAQNRVPGIDFVGDVVSRQIMAGAKNPRMAAAATKVDSPTRLGKSVSVVVAVIGIVLIVVFIGISPY